MTQSETFTTANPDDPSQVVVAYNDSRGRNFNPINISGASFSTDGGNTFTRLTKANGQSPFDNTFGDPVILYHKPSGTWVTVWLDGALRWSGYLAATSPPRPATRIAGLISALSTRALPTANLAGLITIPVRRSLGDCTFPGTTSTSARRSHVHPLD